MFTTIIKPIILLIAISFIFPSSESFGKNPNRNANFREVGSLIQKYIKSEILPKLKDFKIELDNGLPKEDLSTLNDLRSKAKALRNRILELRKEIREAHIEGDGEKFDAKRKEIENLHEQMLDLAKSLKPIAEKNKELLESLGKKAKPFITEWKNDIKEIVKGWIKEHKCEFQDKKVDGRGQRLNKGKIGNHFGFDFDRKRAVARFMLWDGTDDFLKEFDERIGGFDNDFGQIRIDDRNSKGFYCYNYPNPFNDRTKFSFYLPKDETVTITLSDNSGKNLGEICNGKLPAGEHIIYFEPNNSNLKNLMPGAYYYKLQAGKWSKSGKIIYGK